MPRAKHKPYKFQLRKKEIDDVLRWQSRCFDCKEWITIDELQFNGEAVIPCGCDEEKYKTINFAQLTSISRGIKYELETADSPVVD